MKQLELLYGKTPLKVQLPEGCQPTIIRKRAMPVLSQAKDAILKALANPVDAPTLNELARGKSSACILICDITRPVPNHLFLQPLIRVLLGAGLAAKDITVLVATGLHRPNENDELAELVGDPWVLGNVTVANHFARDDATHVDIGTTSKGTRVKLDKRFAQADIKIATGLVEPHFMAGYSGGRKVIAPGIAHAETITTFHNSSFMSHPKAANCVLEGNPLHEEQLEIVKMLGGALALNTVIDEHRNLSFVNFGEIIQSHLGAVNFIRQYAEVAVPRRFKTVVTSAAGYPLDKTYYQTVKGMVGPLEILEPGGNLIIASECSEGLGSREYREAQTCLVSLGVEGFWQEIARKPYADIDEWQTQMQLRPMRVGEIFLYSDKLSNDDKALTGVKVIDSLEQTIASSMRKHHDNQVAFVPEGPYVVPFVTAETVPG
jgi:nickel-dependent lactate racemase